MGSNQSQIKVILFLVERLGPDVLAVRHVLPDNILLDYCRASIIEAKDESGDFLSSGWTIGAVQIRS